MLRERQGPRGCECLFFFYVVPNICDPPVRYPLHVTLLARRILMWLLDFWKIWAPLIKVYIILYVQRIGRVTLLRSDFDVKVLIIRAFIKNARCSCSEDGVWIHYRRQKKCRSTIKQLDRLDTPQDGTNLRWLVRCCYCWWWSVCTTLRNM